MEGLLSTGPTPYSFNNAKRQFIRENKGSQANWPVPGHWSLPEELALLGLKSLGRLLPLAGLLKIFIKEQEQEHLHLCLGHLHDLVRPLRHLALAGPPRLTIALHLQSLSSLRSLSFS